MATVTVTYHYEDGLWWADSPDVPEFSGGGGTFVEAQAMAREGLAFALDGPVDLDERFDEAARAARQRIASVQAYGVDVYAEAKSFTPAATRLARVAVAASVQHVGRAVATSAV